jgi:hypothetical protein
LSEAHPRTEEEATQADLHNAVVMAWILGVVHPPAEEEEAGDAKIVWAATATIEGKF